MTTSLSLITILTTLLMGGGGDVDSDTVQRLSAAGSLVIHILGHPMFPTKPIPHDDLNSLKKLAAEGLPQSSGSFVKALFQTCTSGEDPEGSIC
jgi:hypothetical protein